MKVVFISNYLSHHQRPMSDALAALCQYTFIATSQMPEERLAMGWSDDNLPEYVCCYDREPQRAEACLKEADVVIAGSAPEKLVQSCIRRNQLVLRYAERPLKHGLEPLKFLPRFVKWHLQNPAHRPIYMLCASAYTAGDYARFGLFRGKTLKWGYFPEVRQYEDFASLLERKKKHSILWAGRFLDWKHPDDAVRLAARLRGAGIDFEMTIIGSGEMESMLGEMIIREQLQDRVHMPGAMKPDAVRAVMEQTEVFLFTSDRREGWGAVLNEAMNSGCAVVASDAIGAVPYLLRDGENGCIYRSGDINDLCDKVRCLLADQEKCFRLGEAAYRTMAGCWNADSAARRLIGLAENLMKGKNPAGLYEDGPCTPAEPIKEGWFRT